MWVGLRRYHNTPDKSVQFPYRKPYSHGVGLPSFLLLLRKHYAKFALEFVRSILISQNVIEMANDPVALAAMINIFHFFYTQISIPTSAAAD